MKPLVLLVGLWLPAAAWAQPYRVDGFTTGGGGTSAGGSFSISGTIGQPDAGPAMQNGRYSATGGFWAMPGAVPTPGAPLLTIIRMDRDVIVSWPSPSTGYSLQQITNPGATNWTSFPGLVSDDGKTRRATNSPPFGNKFFRLMRP